MNRKQKAVVWVGMALILATGLYVPVMTEHTFTSDSAVAQIRYFSGYTWIFQPRFHDAPNGQYARSFRHIDATRVLIQWGMVCFAVGGLVSTLGGKTGNRSQRGLEAERVGGS
jgi:hypothetical protein